MLLTPEEKLGIIKCKANWKTVVSSRTSLFLSKELVNFSGFLYFCLVLFEQLFGSICILLRPLDLSQAYRVLLSISEESTQTLGMAASPRLTIRHIIWNEKKKKTVQIWASCYGISVTQMRIPNLLPEQTCLSSFLSSLGDLLLSLQQFYIQATSLKPLELLLIVYLEFHKRTISTSFAFFGYICLFALYFFLSARKRNSKET